MSKKIPLTQGQFAIIDDEDYEWAMQWKWCASENKHKSTTIWYAVRTAFIDGKWRPLQLHREILKRTGHTNFTNFETDHCNRNGLDDRRCNLRAVTRSQNNMNRPKIKGVSQYKGVSKRKTKPKNKWRAQIQIDNKRIHLGYFYSEVKAAKAYDRKALELYGEFARLNFHHKYNRGGKRNEKDGS